MLTMLTMDLTGTLTVGVLTLTMLLFAAMHGLQRRPQILVTVLVAAPLMSCET